MPMSRRAWSPESRAAVIACALTLIVATVAIQTGAASGSLRFIPSSIDPAVVVLMTPMVAIVIAMFTLAARLTWRGSIPELRKHRRHAHRWAAHRA